MKPYRASPTLEAWILRSAPAHHLVARDVSWDELTCFREWNAPIPVSSLHCEHTIFSSVRVNCAMRALLDNLHLTLNRGFDYSSELEVSRLTVHLAKAAGLRETDQHALAFDSAGQTEFHAETGRFPRRQDLWVAECFLHVRYSDAIHSFLTKGYDNA